jgi:hypothetical protein
MFEGTARTGHPPSSGLNMKMCHPHVEDDTAKNHNEFLRLLETMLKIPVNYMCFWR